MAPVEPAGAEQHKHFEDSGPLDLRSSISMTTNPISAEGVANASIGEESFILSASSSANATMNSPRIGAPVSAFAEGIGEMKFQRVSGAGNVMVTMNFGYGLDLSHAGFADPMYMSSDAIGNVHFFVGLFNSSGTNLLSAKPGWTKASSMDYLYYQYHVGPGQSVAPLSLQETWSVSGITTYGTYDLFAHSITYTETPIPEPATLSLIALGGLVSLRKRKSNCPRG
jgi:hypothetical protein